MSWRTTNEYLQKYAKKDALFSPKGHPLEGENVIAKSNGGRECRICKNERNKAYRRRVGIVPNRTPSDKVVQAVLNYRKEFD